MRFHHQTYAFILLFIYSFAFQVPCFADQDVPNFLFDINDSDFSEDNAEKSLSEQIKEFHSKVELEKVDSSADRNETPAIEQAQEPNIKVNLEETNLPATKEEKPKHEEPKEPHPIVEIEESPSIKQETENYIEEPSSRFLEFVFGLLLSLVEQYTMLVGGLLLGWLMFGSMLYVHEKAEEDSPGSGGFVGAIWFHIGIPLVLSIFFGLLAFIAPLFRE